MKSQVGLGRLYPDGRLDQAQDTPQEQPSDADHGKSSAPPDPSDMVSVVVHLEKGALDALMDKNGD
jgi:hypothetical protein